MARSREEIKALMDTAQAASTELSTLNNASQTAEYQLWKELIADIMNQQEQLWDLEEDRLNDLINQNAPATPSWIKNKVFEFQYNALSPQVVQLVNFIPQYPTVDETLRIITRCAVKTLTNSVVQIKVAKSDPPTVLTTLEANALAGYISKLLPAGVLYQLINVAADKLFIEGDIYYDGQYTANIEDDVIASINSYLANLPPDGVVEVSELQNAINDTPGVTDVRITTIKARKDATAFASATIIYDLATSVNSRIWNTVSASIVEETTVGQTFSDKLNFIVAE